jgi:crotonobetainyl-CoA:carnitine CoA-transferase CaiB-like acyl-CoA transferase
VIKVENPKGGVRHTPIFASSPPKPHPSNNNYQDDTRLWRERGEDAIWKADEAGNKTSLYFNTINRNKRSIALDLKSEAGRNVVLQLARGVDVVYVFPPHALSRYSLS